MTSTYPTSTAAEVDPNGTFERAYAEAGGVPVYAISLSGRAEYEADLKARPTYHDGSPRKTWEQLGDVERSSWERR